MYRGAKLSIQSQKQLIKMLPCKDLATLLNPPLQVNINDQKHQIHFKKFNTDIQ